jgi:primosomal replication protein N
MLDLPKQVSVDSKGHAYYEFQFAATRPSGIKDIIPVMVEEGTQAYTDLVAIDQKKDLLTETLMIQGEIRTRNHKRKYEEHMKLYVSVKAKEIVDVGSVDTAEIKGQTNSVYITGYVCKNKGVRITPRGIKITELIVACWTDETGTASYYIPTITWNGTAVRAADRLEPGTEVEIYGRLQSRMYIKVLSEDQEEERMCLELSVSKFEILKEKSERR